MAAIAQMNKLRILASPFPLTRLPVAFRWQATMVVDVLQFRFTYS